MTLRGAYSQSVARPSFRELGYYVSVASSAKTDDLTVGNPQLQLSDVESWDVRSEFLWGNFSDLFAVSLFDKTIEKPIEQIVLRDPSNFEGSAVDTFRTFFNNPSDAKIRGIELEARKSLTLSTFDFLGVEIPARDLFEFLDYVSIGGNYSYFDAEVKRSPAELARSRDFFGDTDGNPQGLRNPPGPTPYQGLKRKRRLYGQPEWIANADITIDQPIWGTQVTLAYFAISDVLDAAGVGTTNQSGDVTQLTLDRYVDSYEQLDLVVSQSLWQGFAIKFSAKNLTDSKRRIVYDPEQTSHRIAERESSRSRLRGHGELEVLADQPGIPAHPVGAPRSVHATCTQMSRFRSAPVISRCERAHRHGPSPTCRDSISSKHKRNQSHDGAISHAKDSPLPVCIGDGRLRRPRQRTVWNDRRRRRRPDNITVNTTWRRRQPGPDSPAVGDLREERRDADDPKARSRGQPQRCAGGRRRSPGSLVITRTGKLIPTARRAIRYLHHGGGRQRRQRRPMTSTRMAADRGRFRPGRRMPGACTPGGGRDLPRRQPGDGADRAARLGGNANITLWGGVLILGKAPTNLANTYGPRSATAPASSKGCRARPTPVTGPRWPRAARLLGIVRYTSVRTAVTRSVPATKSTDSHCARSATTRSRVQRGVCEPRRLRVLRRHGEREPPGSEYVATTTTSTGLHRRHAVPVPVKPFKTDATPTSVRPAATG
jgi:hypothetical protein